MNNKYIMNFIRISSRHAMLHNAELHHVIHHNSQEVHYPHDVGFVKTSHSGSRKRPNRPKENRLVETMESEINTVPLMISLEKREHEANKNVLINA